MHPPTDAPLLYQQQTASVILNLDRNDIGSHAKAPPKRRLTLWAVFLGTLAENFEILPIGKYPISLSLIALLKDTQMN